MTPGLFELKEIRPDIGASLVTGVVLIGAGIRLATTWATPKEIEDRCAGNPFRTFELEEVTTTDHLTHSRPGGS